ncbi:hypothetical protein MTO96_033608 [Rhipicephalus appendiculatus]
MHYLPPQLRKFARQKKRRPSRIKLNQPLDFLAEKSRASTSSSTVHGEEHAVPQAPFGNRLRPRLLGQRLAAAVPVHEGLRQWTLGLQRRRALYAGVVAVAVIVLICGTALIVAWYPDVEKPACDEACMEYTTRFRESMDWSVAPCHDFYRFVCGRAANGTSVRRRLNDRFVASVMNHARNTDYVPRLRGYMREANLHWPRHPATRDPAHVDVLSTMLDLSDKWGLARFAVCVPGTPQR